jgi:hypothetical protein
MVPSPGARSRARPTAAPAWPAGQPAPRPDAGKATLAGIVVGFTDEGGTFSTCPVGTPDPGPGDGRAGGPCQSPPGPSGAVNPRPRKVVGSGPHRPSPTPGRAGSHRGWPPAPPAGHPSGQRWAVPIRHGPPGALAPREAPRRWACGAQRPGVWGTQDREDGWRDRARRPSPPTVDQSSTGALRRTPRRRSVLQRRPPRGDRPGGKVLGRVAPRRGAPPGRSPPPALLAPPGRGAPAGWESTRVGADRPVP